MNINQLNQFTNNRVDSGGAFLWDCYPTAWIIEYVSDYGTINVVFNYLTSEIYEASVVSKNNKQQFYRWLNPESKGAFFTECANKRINPDRAHDNVSYIELEVEEDFLEKATAIYNGQPFDPRIMIHVDLNDDEFRSLALEAHKQDITLNQFITKILTEAVEREEVKCSKPRTRTWDEVFKGAGAYFENDNEDYSSNENSSEMFVGWNKYD